MNILNIKAGSIIIGEAVKRISDLNIIPAKENDKMYYVPINDKENQNEFGVIIDSEGDKTSFISGEGVEEICDILKEILDEGIITAAFDVILDGDKTDAELLAESGEKDLTEDEAKELVESMRRVYKEKKEEKDNMIEDCEEDYHNIIHTLLYYSFDELNKTIIDFARDNHSDDKLPFFIKNLINSEVK
jgi:hypothetical protein